MSQPTNPVSSQSVSTSVSGEGTDQVSVDVTINEADGTQEVIHVVVNEATAGASASIDAAVVGSDGSTIAEAITTPVVADVPAVDSTTVVDAVQAAPAAPVVDPTVAAAAPVVPASDQAAPVAADAVSIAPAADTAAPAAPVVPAVDPTVAAAVNTTVSGS